MLERIGSVYGAVSQILGAQVGVSSALETAACTPAIPEVPAGEAKLGPAPEPGVPFEVDVERIEICEGIRKVTHEVEELAESILAFGILLPLLVVRKKEDAGRYVLVDGKHRLKVCRDLGMQKVPIRVIDLERPVDAEIDANALHKAYTISEKVSIGLMIEKRLGERRGRPKEKTTTVPKGTATTALPWKRAGFRNPETYRQAKSVVESGDAALIARMDCEEISINAAFVLLKPKTSGELPTGNEPKAEVEAAGAALEPQASPGNGRKRNPGEFPPSRTKRSSASASAEESARGDAIAVRPFTQAMVDIQKCLNEHGAFELKPEVVDGALCLPAENTRLALIVAAFKVENLAKLIQEGKLTLKVAE